VSPVSPVGPSGRERPVLPVGPVAPVVPAGSVPPRGGPEFASCDAQWPAKSRGCNLARAQNARTSICRENRAGM
jgi:hypothetical protein